MHSFSIPQSGLNLERTTLHDHAGSGSGPNPSKGLPGSQSQPLQAFRLQLDQSSFDSLISLLRKEPSAARLRLGKRPAIHFLNNKSPPQPLSLAVEQHRSELYVRKDRKNPNGASRQQPQEQQEQQAAYLAGVVSHKLEDPAHPSPADTIATVDTALADLERTLSDIGRDKGSRETTQLDGVGDFRSIKRQHVSRPVSRNYDNGGAQGGIHGRSNAPSLAPPHGSVGSRSPLRPQSASAPDDAGNDKESVWIDALRQPLFHLLATRPMSPTFLAKTTNSSPKLLKPLIDKHTRVAPLDKDKVQLKDQAFRELNIWAFPYPNETDRKDAVENAISAFDRMRISKTDKIWQMLLPKEERGKGKVLSRLNLNVRPPPTAVGATRKHAPKRPASSVTAAGAAAAGDSDGSAKKRMTNSNTTLTGRVTKKTAGETKNKKTTSTTSGTPDSKKVGANNKYKSSEVIVDSDDELEMGEIPSSPHPHNDETEPKKKPSSPAPVKNIPPQSSEKPHTKDRPVSSNGQRRPISRSRSPSTVARPASHHLFSARQPPDSRSSSSSSSTMKSSRNVSSTTAATSVANYSPRPYVLGSSPLVNGGGYEDSKTDATKKTSPASTTPRPPTTTTARGPSSGSKLPPSKLHTSASAAPTRERPLKRKAEQPPEPGHQDSSRAHANPKKRPPVQRPISNASSTATNSSNTGSFQSNDSLRNSRLYEITSDTHSSPSPPPQPARAHRGAPTSLAAGKARNTNNDTESNTSTKQPGEHELALNRIIDNAQAFKNRYPVYERLHAALAMSASRNPDGRPSKGLLDKFYQEDERLRAMKRQIVEECERLPKKKTTPH